MAFVWKNRDLLRSITREQWSGICMEGAQGSRKHLRLLIMYAARFTIVENICMRQNGKSTLCICTVYCCIWQGVFGIKTFAGGGGGF